MKKQFTYIQSFDIRAMWSFRVSAALAVLCMCVLLCSAVSPQSGSSGSRARDSSFRGPKKTGEVKRSELTTNNRVGSAVVRCRSECRLYFGHIIDDQTGEKIHISKAERDTTCSCTLSPVFKKKLKNSGAEEMPRGSKCVGQMKKHKCSCGISDKMKRYMDRNNMDTTSQVCLIQTFCKCGITPTFVKYIRGHGADLNTFQSAVNNGGTTAIPDFLGEMGIEVIKERADETAGWYRREVPN